MNESETIHFIQNDRTEDAHAERAISIYEVHPASWKRVPEENNRPLKSTELGPKLADYAERLNFTHIQLYSSADLPCQFSTEELRRLIDVLHEHNLGVILDGMPPDLRPAGVTPAALWHSQGVANAVEDLHADGVRDGEVTFLSEAGRDVALRRETGWVRGVLSYMSNDPFFRKFHHGDLSVRNYEGNEVVLALSHENFGGGRRSLMARMPGDEWQKFANLRLLLACLWAQPGKKLVFMGGEFGQWSEWNPNASLDWHLAREGSRHQGLQQMVAELNRLYREQPALQADGDPHGFEWGDRSDARESAIDWLRKGAGDEILLAAFNFTPVPRHNHRVGVPRSGKWEEIFNSDAREFGGSGQGNLGGVEASPLGWQQHSHSLTVTLPPLGAVFFKGPPGLEGH